MSYGKKILLCQTLEEQDLLMLMKLWFGPLKIKIQNTYLTIYQDIDYQTYLNHEYFIIGADQNGPHQIENSDHNKKIVLVLGNESRGIDISIKNKMSKLISIEKLGYGESLNLAIAGSILMKNIAIK